MAQARTIGIVDPSLKLRDLPAVHEIVDRLSGLLANHHDAGCGGTFAEYGLGCPLE